MERASDVVGGVVDSNEIPLEVLERKLTGRAADLAAAEAEWMGWLAEYDERRGWAEWGCLGPAHWLSWKCGLSPSAARERVRVATALTGLPLIRAAFAGGELSYSKVQALTRIANEFNESDLVSMAKNATGAQLARICAGYRSSATTDEAAAEAFVSLSISSRQNHDGSTTVALRIPDADAKQVLAHVETVATSIIDDAVASTADDTCAQASLTRREAIAERNGIASVRADAAIALLTGQAIAVEPTPTDLTMIVDADQHAAAQADRPASDTCAQVSEPVDVLIDDEIVAAPVARRLLCDPRVTALIESATHGPLAIGRATRLINRRMRRTLKRRDHGACQFPGCHATQRLHAHHIVHWSDGGPTDLDNLISLCHFHHHLVHEGGWSISTTDGTRFHTPDGTPVEPTPGHLCAGVAAIEPGAWADSSTSTNSLEPLDYGPFDLPWTTTILHHNEALRRSSSGSSSS